MSFGKSKIWGPINIFEDETKAKNIANELIMNNGKNLQLVIFEKARYFWVRTIMIIYSKILEQKAFGDHKPIYIVNVSTAKIQEKNEGTKRSIPCSSEDSVNVMAVIQLEFSEKIVTKRVNKPSKIDE